MPPPSGFGALIVQLSRRCIDAPGGYVSPESGSRVAWEERRRQFRQIASETIRRWLRADRDLCARAGRRLGHGHRVDTFEQIVDRGVREGPGEVVPLTAVDPEGAKDRPLLQGFVR